MCIRSKGRGAGGDGAARAPHPTPPVCVQHHARVSPTLIGHIQGGIVASTGYPLGGIIALYTTAKWKWSRWRTRRNGPLRGEEQGCAPPLALHDVIPTPTLLWHDVHSQVSAASTAPLCGQSSG